MSATLHDRLEAMRRSITRLEGVVRMLSADHPRISEREDIQCAALEELDTLSLQVCWCHNVPDEALAMPAPDDDETGGAR